MDKYKQLIVIFSDTLKKSKDYHIAYLHGIGYAWTGDTFADLCGRYWDKLKEIEKEIISNAMDDGLNEEQMINIFLAPTDDMDNLRRAYVIDNKRNGDDR